MKIVRSLLAATALCAIAAVAVTAEPPRLEIGSFHAKVKTTTTAQGQNVTMDGEFWIKDKKMRMEMTSPMGAIVNVMDDKTIWMWYPAQKQGMKIAVTEQNKQSSLLHANDCLKGAKSLGEETVDGVLCDKFEYADCGATGTTTTMWIARGKKWPKKMVAKSAQGTSTMVYSDVQTGEAIADKLFVPPTDITFQDMAAMMKQMQQQPGAAPKK